MFMYKYLYFGVDDEAENYDDNITADQRTMILTGMMIIMWQFYHNHENDRK